MPRNSSAVSTGGSPVELLVGSFDGLLEGLVGSGGEEGAEALEETAEEGAVVPALPGVPVVSPAPLVEAAVLPGAEPSETLPAEFSD